MLHGPQRDQVNLSFSIPSLCAQQVEEGAIDVGLVPVAEIARQGLDIVPGVGIACFGVVRSILLFSRVPWKQVRTLAADLSSRTSVQLARVILRESFGVEPAIESCEPILSRMLESADAALVIGDPALAISPAESGFDYLDLGNEWRKLTNLPMVFAAWAGKPGLDSIALEQITVGSYKFGKAHLDSIVESEFARRNVTRELASEYLQEHIRFELGDKELEGLETFFALANLSRPAFA